MVTFIGKPELFSEKLEQAIPMYLSTVFTWHLTGVAVTVLIVWTIMHLVINTYEVHCDTEKFQMGGNAVRMH